METMRICSILLLSTLFIAVSSCRSSQHLMSLDRTGIFVPLCQKECKDNENWRAIKFDRKFLRYNKLVIYPLDLLGLPEGWVNIKNRKGSGWKSLQIVLFAREFFRLVYRWRYGLVDRKGYVYFVVN